MYSYGQGLDRNFCLGGLTYNTNLLAYITLKIYMCIYILAYINFHKHAQTHTFIHT